MSTSFQASAIDTVPLAALFSMLRNARALIHRDSESFDQAANVLEHVGQLLAGELKNGLNGYKTSLFALARQGPESQRERLEVLFDTVRKARNDSVHSGAYVRHHAMRLIEFILLLEESILMTAATAQDLMVQDPVIAQPWQNIADLRRLLLTNSFSYLPMMHDGKWKLLADFAIVKYLSDANSTSDRNVRLGRQIGALIDDATIAPIECSRIPPSTPISELATSAGERPLLVVETSSDSIERLVGIISAFDLL